MTFNEILMVLLALAAIIGVYLSYFYRPTKIEIIKRHSDDLKKLVDGWISEVPEVSSANDPIRDEPSPLEIPVEKEYLFSDLENHIPPDLKLFEIWKTFKSEYNKYAEKRHRLFNDIKEEVVRRTGLTFGWVPNGVSELFVDYIYFDAFNLAKGEDRRHDDLKWRSEGKEGNFELWVPGYGFARGSTKDILERVKNVYIDMMRELENSGYVNTAKSLINDQKTLTERRTELLRELRGFISVPIFPGECKYIEWSLASILYKIKRKFSG